MRPRKYGSRNLQTAVMLIQEQGGCCAICRKSLKYLGSDRGRTRHLDHCHLTGFVRGLLCSQCNNGLGMFEDNPAILARAILYLTHLPQRIAGFEDGARYVPIWPIYAGDKTEQQVPPHVMQRERNDFDDAMRAAANGFSQEDDDEVA